MTTAFIVGGGGSRGILSSGMLTAAHDLGIDYQVILGSSVGSINAVVYQSGNLAFLKQMWMDIHNNWVYNVTPWRAFANPPSFYDTTPLRKLLTAHASLANLQSNPRKCVIAATNVKTWSADSVEVHELIDEPMLIDWLMRSSSAPIAFPPQQDYYDAGLTSNYNIMQAIKAGATNLIIFEVSVPEFKSIMSLVGAFEAVASIPEYAQLGDSLAYIDLLNQHLPNKITYTVIRPDKPTNISLLDFEYKGMNREDLFEWGYSLAETALKNQAR